MTLIIDNNNASNNGVDGIHIGSQKRDITITNNTTNNNGRYGIFIQGERDALIAAGLKPETPDCELQRAFQELAPILKSPMEKKERALKRIGFTQWLTRTAEISTIISLICQIFQK
ncbi:right-handed parallel beta-helix repeat-containing protein [Sodalis sp. RH21]|uniref:right-handed parallel beta-helix repeat-containing protein n=1 Tax=unclassified Sodalis (in: enterobacteria) TaxID=2636512 RepID=UPI0039B4FC1A